MSKFILFKNLVPLIILASAAASYASPILRKALDEAADLARTDADAENGAAGLSRAAEELTVSAVAADGVSSTSKATVPKVTSFSSANNAIVKIGGDQYSVQNANRNWSVNSSDDRTLRFELRPGDVWPSEMPGHDVERSEIAGMKMYPLRAAITLSYKFKLERGPKNTAPWIVLGQFHESDLNTSPPFAVYMRGENMRIALRYQSPGQTEPTNCDIYIDRNPIERGNYYSMRINVRFDNAGDGFLYVWRNDIQIVRYEGPIGYGTETYWKEGIYRFPSAEIVAAKFRDLLIDANGR